MLRVHFILRVSADAKIKHAEIAAAGVYGCYSLFGPSAGQAVIKNNVTFEKRTAQTGTKDQGYHSAPTTAGLCARHLADQKFVVCVCAFLQL